MKLKIFGKLADIFHGNEYDLDSEKRKVCFRIKSKTLRKIPGIERINFFNYRKRRESKR